MIVQTILAQETLLVFTSLVVFVHEGMQSYHSLCDKSMGGLSQFHLKGSKPHFILYVTYRVSYRIKKMCPTSQYVLVFVDLKNV